MGHQQSQGNLFLNLLKHSQEILFISSSAEFSTSEWEHALCWKHSCIL